MRDLRNPNAPLLLFAVAAIASGALLLALGSELSFLSDDWAFFLYRRGFGADQILDPHNVHIVVVPVLIYKAVLAIFGLGSQQPFRVASAPIFVISVILLFAWLRRRVGDWLALAGALPVLFLGTAGEILLWPFPQIGFCGPMAAGLGAFLALDRSSRRGDLLACGLLTLSILFGTLGTAFAVGAVVHIAWDRRRWQRAYIAAIPIGVYAIWWLGWGHQASSDASLLNLLKSPLYVVEGFGSGVSSLLALPELDFSSSTSLDPGLPLVLLLFALAAVRIYRLGHLSRWLAVVTATALGFWLPAALNASEQRSPTEPRYQYMAAIFVLLIAAELLRGVRIGRRALIAVLAVALLATVGNLAFLYRAFQAERQISEQSRGALAGLEISRASVDPEFWLGGENSGVDDLRLVYARPYFAAIAEFGSPAYPQSELPEAPEPAREAADRVLWNALPGAVASGASRPAGPPPRLTGSEGRVMNRLGSCLAVAPGAARRSTLALPPGGALLLLAPGETAELGLRRYAERPFPIGRVTGATPTIVRIPADRSTVPWRLELLTSSDFRICGIKAG